MPVRNLVIQLKRFVIEGDHRMTLSIQSAAHYSAQRLLT